MLLVVAVLAVTRLVDWYGTALRYDYPPVEIFGRHGEPGGTAEICAGKPAAHLYGVCGLAVRARLVLGELGTFGAMDLSIPVVQLFSVLALCLGAALAVHEKSSLTPKSAVGLLGLAVFYVFGVMAAQYITLYAGGPAPCGGRAGAVSAACISDAVCAGGRAVKPCAGACPRRRRAPRRGAGAFRMRAVAAISAVLLFQHYLRGACVPGAVRRAASRSRGAVRGEETNAERMNALTAFLECLATFFAVCVLSVFAAKSGRCLRAPRPLPCCAARCCGIRPWPASTS